RRSWRKLEIPGCHRSRSRQGPCPPRPCTSETRDDRHHRCSGLVIADRLDLAFCPPSSLLGFARSEWITRESRFYSRKVEGERRMNKMSDERDIYSSYAPQLLHRCFFARCCFYC